jgi:hypothetical protein
MTITAIHDCRIDDIPFVMGMEYEAETTFGTTMWIMVYTVWGTAMMTIAEARRHFMGV